jgi:hypothetical protein
MRMDASIFESTYADTYIHDIRIIQTIRILPIYLNDILVFTHKHMSTHTHTHTHTHIEIQSSKLSV